MRLVVRPHGILEGSMSGVKIVRILHGNVAIAVSGHGSRRHGRGRGDVGAVEDHGLAGGMMDHGKAGSRGVSGVSGGGMLRVVVAVSGRSRGRLLGRGFSRHLTAAVIKSSRCAERVVV